MGPCPRASLCSRIPRTALAFALLVTTPSGSTSVAHGQEPEPVPVAGKWLPAEDLTGRVRDGEARGVAAEISLWRWPEAEDARSRPEASGRSNPEGHFALSLPAAGTWRVLAEDPRGRSAAIDVVIPSPAQAITPIEIVVVGPGVLRGCIRDRSGVPAAGLDLVIVRQGLHEDSRERRPGLLRDFQSALLNGGGRLRSWATTDLEGRFECRDLRDDLFEVWATVGFQDHPLTPTPIRADGQDVRLSFERPHLVVRVLDEDGKPWERIATLEEISGRPLQLHAASPTSIDVWPARPGVRVDALGEPSRAGGEIAPPAGTPVGDRIVFDVHAGRHYRVGLFGGDQPWLPVEVEAATGRTEVELHVLAARPLGMLEVTARDAGGVLDDRLSIRVEDPEDGFPLLQSTPYPLGQWPRSMSVPAGTWRVVVEGCPEVFLDSGQIEKSAQQGRFESLVRVESARTTLVDAVLPAGARLQVTPTGALPPGPEPLDEWEAFQRQGVRLTLHAPGRWPHLVVFEGPKHDRLTDLQEALTLNTTATSELLPAGRWTLEGRFPDGRVARTEVVLVDGETTTARLELD